MSQVDPGSDAGSIRTLTLVVRRTIRASAARLFDAWTQPEQLRQWWGPTGVRCIEAHVDLWVGGGYRIGNQLPDGHVVWIVGEFEAVVPASLLVYSWSTGGAAEPERVTVRFEPLDGATEVIIEHERIADRSLRDQHERGWDDCLQGLERFVIPS